MASYNKYTGTVCENGHKEFYQVVEINTWGGERIESRRGPSCWRADCEAHRQWSTERRAG